MSEETNTKQGISRREMLRRSAIVGGNLVWMAPAVQTLVKPAFASHGTNTATSRTRCYRYYYILTGKVGVVTQEATYSAAGCQPTDGSNAADSGGPTVTVTFTPGDGSTVNDQVSAVITGVGEGSRSNCVFVDNTYVAATQSQSPNCATSKTLGPGNKSVTVVSTHANRRLSTLRLVVCCSPP